MSEKITTRDDALRAGRLVAAVDADDGRQITSILREAAGQPAGVLSLCLELAAICAGAAKQAHGEAWRGMLDHALHDLAMEQMLADAPHHPDSRDGRS